MLTVRAPDMERVTESVRESVRDRVVERVKEEEVVSDTEAE